MSLILLLAALSLIFGAAHCLDSVQVPDIRQCNRRGECTSQQLHQGASKTLHIGLMLSFPDPLQRKSLASSAFDDGHDLAPAAYLAVEQINNHSDILQDYTIELSRFDGGCEVSTRLRTTVGMNNVYCSCERIVGIIGPSCEASSQIVSDLTNREEFSMITINFGGQNESVGNYPYSFGILGRNDNYVRMIAELVIQKNWTNTALLYYGSIDFYSRESRELVQLLNSRGYRFQYQTAVYDTFIPFAQVKESFARVIVLLTTIERRLRVLCMAYHESMTYPKYLWIFDEIVSPKGNVSFTYLGIDYFCSEEEITAALHGSIHPFLHAVRVRPNSPQPTSSGFSVAEFYDGYKQQTKVYSEAFNVSS